LAAVAFETALGYEPDPQLVAQPEPSNPRAPISPSSTSADEALYPESRSLAVLGYTLWRLAETARTALLALVAVVALALLAQLVH